MELTACPPSAGSASTRATLRPRREASRAAEIPAMPAPSTQMSAPTCCGAACCALRTTRVVVETSALIGVRFAGLEHGCHLRSRGDGALHHPCGCGVGALPIPLAVEVG